MPTFLIIIQKKAGLTEGFRPYSYYEAYLPDFPGSGSVVGENRERVIARTREKLELEIQELQEADWSLTEPTTEAIPIDFP